MTYRDLNDNDGERRKTHTRGYIFIVDVRRDDDFSGDDLRRSGGRIFGWLKRPRVRRRISRFSRSLTRDISRETRRNFRFRINAANSIRHAGSARRAPRHAFFSRFHLALLLGGIQI